MSTRRTLDSAEQAYVSTLQSLRDPETRYVPLRPGEESPWDCWEELNFSFNVTNAQDRITWNPHSRFRLPLAAARFVWMMGANDRLADIAFYTDAVRMFSDDGIIVPGSSYGHRILNSSPGINQLTGVIGGLRAEPHSKRAAIAVYQAEDAIRFESRDIPCTFGFAFHIRDDKLNTTILMRSNNAYLLLPFNFFEFSLFGEIVASELGVEVGPVFYHAMSMHLIKDDKECAQSVIDAGAQPSVQMTPMPASGLAQVTELVKLESDLRHAASGITDSSFREWIKEGEQRLDSYWNQIYLLLLYHCARTQRLADGLKRVEEVLEEPFRNSLGPDAFVIDPGVEPVAQDQMHLFGDLATATVRIEDSGYTKLLEEFESLIEAESARLVERGQAPMSFAEHKLIRDKLIGQPGKHSVAARSVSGLGKAIHESIMELRS